MSKKKCVFGFQYLVGWECLQALEVTVTVGFMSLISQHAQIIGPSLEIRLSL